MAFVNENISEEDRKKLKRNIKLSESLERYGRSEYGIYSLDSFIKWAINKKDNIFFMGCGYEKEFVEEVSRELASDVNIFVLCSPKSVYFFHIRFLPKFSNTSEDDPYKATWELCKVHHANGVELVENDCMSLFKSAMDCFVTFGYSPEKFKNAIVELRHMSGDKV